MLTEDKGGNNNGLWRLDLFAPDAATRGPGDLHPTASEVWGAGEMGESFVQLAGHTFTGSEFSGVIHAEEVVGPGWWLVADQGPLPFSL